MEGDIGLFLLIGDHERFSKLLDQFCIVEDVQSMAATLKSLESHGQNPKFYTLKPEKHIYYNRFPGDY